MTCLVSALAFIYPALGRVESAQFSLEMLGQPSPVSAGFRGGNATLSARLPSSVHEAASLNEFDMNLNMNKIAQLHGNTFRAGPGKSGFAGLFTQKLGPNRLAVGFCLAGYSQSRQESAPAPSLDEFGISATITGAATAAKDAAVSAIVSVVKAAKNAGQVAGKTADAVAQAAGDAVEEISKCSSDGGNMVIYLVNPNQANPRLKNPQWAKISGSVRWSES